jgi:hypothetical protein
MSEAKPVRPQPGTRVRIEVGPLEHLRGKTGTIRKAHPRMGQAALFTVQLDGDTTGDKTTLCYLDEVTILDGTDVAPCNPSEG